MNLRDIFEHEKIVVVDSSVIVPGPNNWYDALYNIADPAKLRFYPSAEYAANLREAIDLLRQEESVIVPAVVKEVSTICKLVAEKFGYLSGKGKVDIEVDNGGLENLDLLADAFFDLRKMMKRKEFRFGPAYSPLEKSITLSRLGNLLKPNHKRIKDFAQVRSNNAASNADDAVVAGGFYCSSVLDKPCAIATGDGDIALIAQDAVNTLSETARLALQKNPVLVYFLHGGVVRRQTMIHTDY